MLIKSCSGLEIAPSNGTARGDLDFVLSAVMGYGNSREQLYSHRDASELQ